jgi:C-terminal processing protease CtpA/Prc
MRLSFGIAMACLAASLSAQVTLQVGGSSYLGIGVADITAERAKALNLKDGPAGKAGIKAGDVVVKVGDSTVTTPREIARELVRLGSRQTFTVVVVRDKKEIPLTVTREERAGGPSCADPPVKVGQALPPNAT